MTRRRKIGIALCVAVISATGASILLAPGCAGRTDIAVELHPSGDRQRHLVMLAAEEAALVTEIDRRLTRQLNLAEQQINLGWPDDARKTLASSLHALSSEESAALGDHVVISGWVSASELARRADGDDLAEAACDRAIEALLAVQSPAERCQYVLGVANEIHHLKAAGDAAALLEKAGPWVRHIDDLQMKREALVAFASALFNLDEYERGQNVLRCDEDAAWRSDTLLLLARQLPVDQGPTDASLREAAAAPVLTARDRMEPTESEPLRFGKPVDYESVFQHQVVPRTGSAEQ